MEILAKACAELFRTVNCLELATYTNSHSVKKPYEDLETV